MFVTPAEFTVPVRGDLELLEVPRATVTTFGKGRLRVAWGQPSRFVTGAVHDDGGVLVPASQRVGGLHYDHAVAADPGSLPPWAGRTEELAGTWLFGGTWFNHFGHFLTETLTTLWHREAVDGILFVPFWFGREVLDWQTELLALAGRREPVRVVGAERVRVERLLVPERPVIPNGHVRPEAYDVWRSVASAARSAPGPPSGSSSPGPGTTARWSPAAGLRDGSPTTRSSSTRSCPGSASSWCTPRSCPSPSRWRLSPLRGCSSGSRGPPCTSASSRPSGPRWSSWATRVGRRARC